MNTSPQTVLGLLSGVVYTYLESICDGGIKIFAMLQRTSIVVNIARLSAMKAAILPYGNIALNRGH